MMIYMLILITVKPRVIKGKKIKSIPNTDQEIKMSRDRIESRAPVKLWHQSNSISIQLLRFKETRPTNNITPFRQCLPTMASVRRCQTKSRTTCLIHFKLPSSKLRSSRNEQQTIIPVLCLICQPSQVIKIGAMLIFPWHTCMRTRWQKHQCSGASTLQIYRQRNRRLRRSIPKIGSKSVFHQTSTRNIAKGTNKNRKDSVLEWKGASIRPTSERELLALAISLTYSMRQKSFLMCPADPIEMLYQLLCSTSKIHSSERRPKIVPLFLSLQPRSLNVQVATNPGS